MTRLRLMNLLAGAVLVAAQAAAQHTVQQRVRMPLRPTPATSGAEMYAAYCSSCHGVKGRSDGVIAPLLRTPPPDLTLLSQRNGGVFPYSHVASVLRFGTRNTIHGSADMPIWGEMFQTLSVPGQIEVQVRVRVVHLADYLKTIQR